jgi:uncharacterized membrane protein
MKNKQLMILTTAVCLIPMLLAAVLYNQLPDKIPIHFNASGAADNYVPKAIACFALPAALALLNLFLHFRINADPKIKNASGIFITIQKWCVPVLVSVFVPVSLFISLGNAVPVQIIAPALVGILILICGNYLPKSRQNYTVGIKLPWTLNNEENWNKTHRLAGVLWVIGGLTILIACALQFYTFYVLLIVIVLLTAIPFVYSYCMHRKGL